MRKVTAKKQMNDQSPKPQMAGSSEKHHNYVAIYDVININFLVFFTFVNVDISSYVKVRIRL